MADTDTIDVTFKTQKVWHDGTSMIVAKEGETWPLATRRVQGFIDEGAIEVPEGWETIGGASVDALVTSDGAQLIATGPIPFVDDDAPAGDEDVLAATFDHDGDGIPGGSKPHDPPALSGLNKAELLAQAEAEGVDVDDTMTKAQITEAIEAARADSADDDAPAT